MKEGVGDYNKIKAIYLLDKNNGSFVESKPFMNTVIKMNLNRYQNLNVKIFFLF